MSRVAIKNLCWDAHLLSNTSWADVKDIEVVPRKMVEMIIKKCEEEINSCHKSAAAVAEASIIKRYAEKLLEQFEGDD